MLMESRRFLEQYLEQFAVVMPLASVDAPITMIRAKRQVMWHFLAWMALLTTVLALLTTTAILRPGLLARSTAWTA